MEMCCSMMCEPNVGRSHALFEAVARKRDRPRPPHSISAGATGAEDKLTKRGFSVVHRAISKNRVVESMLLVNRLKTCGL